MTSTFCNGYFDYAATTPLRPEVLETMLPYLQNGFGNPSAKYGLGYAAKKAVDNARCQIADAINAKPEEIFFTASGTESDNWAVKGIANALKHRGKHIITTSIEHHAVLHTAKFLQENGYDITYLTADENGFISLDSLEKAIRPDTILVSVMTANNEVGAIQPIAEIGAITRKNNILLHTDAVQAAGHILIDIKDWQVDLLSMSAHKFYGPKGVSALYIRNDTPINPLLHGGAHESNKRAGTENVAGIVGMGEALTLAVHEMEGETVRLAHLRDRLYKGIKEQVPYVILNSPLSTSCLAGILNISFIHAEGLTLVMLLDFDGFSASAGSACAMGSPSHVLTAMGVSPERINTALRFSMGKYTTESDVDALIATLGKKMKKLQEMSPTYITKEG